MASGPNTGKLEARKVDGIWLVDKASVDARLSAIP